MKTLLFLCLCAALSAEDIFPTPLAASFGASIGQVWMLNDAGREFLREHGGKKVNEVLHLDQMDVIFLSNYNEFSVIPSPHLTRESLPELKASIFAKRFPTLDNTEGRLRSGVYGVSSTSVLGELIFVSKDHKVFRITIGRGPKIDPSSKNRNHTFYLDYIALE